jgi:hypothetical protein
MSHDEPDAMQGVTVPVSVRDGIEKQLRDAEVAQHATGSEWLNNIEPEAKAYYEHTQDAEQTFLFSIAVTLMRMASAPAVAENRDTEWVNERSKWVTEGEPFDLKERVRGAPDSSVVAHVRSKVSGRVHAARKKGKDRIDQIGKRVGDAVGKSKYIASVRDKLKAKSAARDSKAKKK